MRKAAGQPVEGELNGTWGEANLYKFMQTAACALSSKRDPILEERIDGIVDLLAAGQQPDGYLHVYVTNNKKAPWDPAFLDGSHDGYVLGHLIEAALEDKRRPAKSKAPGHRPPCRRSGLYALPGPERSAGLLWSRRAGDGFG